jgi:CRP/FNR family cyclic AMP-dependent transcriptional regulator
MDTTDQPNDFFIWGIDFATYGPVPLPTLIEWIKDERVLADTWVYTRATHVWHVAKDVPELAQEFKTGGATAKSDPIASTGIKPGSLRRIKILADMNDLQLAHLAQYLEPMNVLQWACVCKQGDPGDGMYLVLGGELRARLMVNGQETILANFEAGEFFGDMSLFDHGPRSADVMANADSQLFKLSVANFTRLLRDAPALATPFLQASARTLAARIRADNKRLTRLTQQFSSSGNR